MNKIRQNKITFTLILSAIIIIFSSFTILSLPVLFNYKSKVAIIEKNFYKNFKISMNSSGNISYKPFPKPHLLLENASLNLYKSIEEDNSINTSNLKIYISLKDIYSRSFNNLILAEITNTNLELKIKDLIEFRNHLYKKINKPIKFNNCKIFIKNKKNEVILISPINKILYKINNKTKVKNLKINGEVYGFNFKSHWKRSYITPNISHHSIDTFNPNIEIKNIFEFENNKKFKGKTQIEYANDKLEYDFQYLNDKITIFSPDKNKTNFNLEGEIQLKPFYFQAELTIKNKKVEDIIDNILSKILSDDENLLGNLNGEFKIKFEDLKNKLLKSGEIDFFINEKKINTKNSIFELEKIGKIYTKLSFIEDKGELKFVTENQLNIENHIEFAKLFQVGSKKIKNIKKIYFILEKNFGDTDFIIRNIKLNNEKNYKNIKEIFLVKNIHNLRSYIREVVNQ